MQLTIRHRFDFSDIAPMGEQLDRAAWDRLRQSDSGFGFAEVAPAEIALRATAVLGIIRDLGARKVCSYGIGTGLLERHLLGAVDLTVTEYAPATLARLYDLFPSVVAHDLRDGPLSGFDLHILHRVDTELSDREWREYFALVTEPHLVIVSNFVGPAILAGEFVRWCRGYTVAGWLRTKGRFESLLPANAKWASVVDLDAYVIP